MGEAKRKAAARTLAGDTPPQVDMARVAGAMRRLAVAASGSLGSDCYSHAVIVQAILARLGVAAEIRAGYAAWRVGNGDGDVILHAPTENAPPQPGAIFHHVWLEIGNQLLDVTTYQLRTKAAQLDAMDGGRTDVKWCPDFLYAPIESASPLQLVIQREAGLYYYDRQAGLEELMFSTAKPLDEVDLEAAWLLYCNPNAEAIGLNNVAEI